MKNPTSIRFVSPRRPSAALFLSVSLLLGVSASHLFAQTSPAPADKAGEGEAVLLNQYVVTGSVTPRTKLESPVAITTIDRTKVDDLAPRNLGEMLKSVPGIYVESTGGEAFNNVSIRGFGVTNGFSYEVLQEDGLPVISTNNLRHGLPDAWTRMSTFIVSVEALRSGTSNVFASNAPLALINFISREGGTSMEGEVALSTSDYGTLRSDMWVSGPLGKNTTFALGGWYRVDDGVRDPGFTANKGGELMGNVKHTFENGRGHVKASFKIHDDHNVFDLPMPLTGLTNPHSIPFGPDMKRDATSASLDQRILSIPGTPIGNVNYDLADGIYSQMNYFGTEVQYKLAENITVENRNRYSDGFRSIDYAFNATPTPWQAIANAAAGRDAAQFAAGLTGTNYAFRLTYPGQGNAVAAANATAAAALGNGYGNRKSWQHSEGDVTDFQNDLRLIGIFNDDKTTVSGGVYYSFLTTEQHYLFNTILTDVTPSPKRVDITIVNATTGADIGPATANGLYHFADQYRNADAEEREVSPYASLEHKFGNFSFDAGIRHNIVRQTATRELTANATNLSATNPALKGGQFGTGQIVTRENKNTENAYSTGLNYLFTKHLSSFARYSRGVRFLGITELTDDMHANRVTSPSRIITGYEAGVKWGTSRLGVVVTAFHEELKGIQDTQVTIDPITGLLGPTVIAIAQQESQGVEVETVWTPISGLSLGLNGSVQKVKWTDHNLKTQTLSTGQVVAFDENGKTPERTPEVAGKFMASYRFPETAFGTFSVNGSYQYTGSRPTDRVNSSPSPLKAYGETQIGVALVTKNGFTVRVSVNNVFDDEGLSEGDPRTGSNVLDPTVSVYNARPIQPRTITGTVSYRF